MQNLSNSFKKESKKQKLILSATAIIFVASFLPWFSLNFGGFGSFSANGWHRFGLLTALGSLALVLDWLLPKIGVKLDIKMTQDKLQRILVVIMLAGPVLWLLDGSFEFGIMGIGFYMSLVASILATYLVFTTKKV